MKVRIFYKRPHRYANAMHVWPSFERQLGHLPAQYLVAWYMRDVLLPPGREPCFGDPR